MCSHGVPHGRPCAGCWGTEIRKRQCRKTGGQFSGGALLRAQTLIVEEQDRYDNELRLLAVSDLNDEQRTEVRGWLDTNHEVSRADLRRMLERAQAKAA
jgi:hypothetical protein